MVGRIALVLVVLAVGLGVMACGGDDDAADTTTTETTTEDDSLVAGRAVFTQTCGPCHTLSNAGTTGTIGPSLDGTPLSAEEIEEQVRDGGGGMPAFEGDLSEDEIADVSEYVAEVAGG